jgi:hypothetical protein
MTNWTAVRDCAVVRPRHAVRVTRRLTPFLLAALLVLSGCLGLPEASLADGPLVEKWRLASPLPAPAGRQWALTDPRDGLLGEGRRLVSADLVRGVLRWQLDLPARYAVTPGSVSVGVSTVLLLGLSGSFLAVSRYDGHRLWEQSGSQAVVAGDSPDAAAYVAGCAKSGCDITAREQDTGKVRWRRHFTERVTMTAAGQSTGGVYLLGDRTMALVNPSDGRTQWSLARPPGAHQTVFASLYRAILFTPPALPGCRATFRGVDAGRIVWTRTARWQDAGAPGAPCTYDPARLMFAFTNPEIPVAGALLQLDSYHGTAGSTPLDPGEYLVAGGVGLLTWTPGIGYRSRESGTNPKPAPVPPPADGRPWAEGHIVVWLLSSGPDVVLYSPGAGIVWSRPAPVPVLVAQDRVVYLDGTTLVGAGPEDPKR